MPKMRKNSNNYASSEDGMINKGLPEVTDTQLLEKSMFDEGTYVADERELPNEKNNDVEKYDEFGSLKGVSEGFKNIVAERLAELLDRNIEMTEQTISSKHSRKRKQMEHEESDCGIRLLRTSGSFLTSVVINASSHECTSRSRIKSVKKVTSKDNLLRCKEAAVDPQWLLSKVETKFWSNKPKGTVYEYKKLADGTLIEK